MPSTRPKLTPARLAVALASLALLAACGPSPDRGTVDDDATATAAAEAPVINIYSARHYQSDEQLYQAFTDATGIEVRRIEGTDDALIQRILQEGEATPAD